MDRQDDNRPKLSEEVLELVKSNGGWLNVIPRLTSSFDAALKNHGHLVDCPFPHRHRNGEGRVISDSQTSRATKTALSAPACRTVAGTQ